MANLPPWLVRLPRPRDRCLGRGNGEDLRALAAVQADAAEQELDRARAEIVTAYQMVALAITREWESRLLRLLAADADAAAELSRIVVKLSQSCAARILSYAV